MSNTKVDFSHLHIHSEYSLLDGVMKVGPMIKKLKDMGHRAVAVTDHGVMYSLVRVNKACREAGIKHVIGCEFYVAPHSRFDKQAKKGEAVYNHLIVLAKDKIGYNQLINMCSLGFMEGFYYKPRIDEDLLFGQEKGHLIVTTACIGSAFAQSLMNGVDIRDYLEKYVRHFGEDFFMEVQNHGIQQELDVQNAYEYYSSILGVPIIATQDSHYLNKEDYLAHDVALCIGTGQNLVDERKFKFDGTNYHLLTTEEMLALYKPEWLDNTKLVVNKCQDDGIIEYGKLRLPKFQPPSLGTDPEFDRWLASNGGESA